MKRKRNQIQNHHISYEPEVLVKIYQGEHWTLTIINRRTKNISKGFIDCLQKYIDEHKDKAVDLSLA